MQQVSALVFPRLLFNTSDTLRSMADNYEVKAPVLFRYGKGPHFTQVGWVDSVECREDGLYGILSVPDEGANLLNEGKLVVRGELSLIAISGNVIESARLVEVRLLPK